MKHLQIHAVTLFFAAALLTNCGTSTTNAFKTEAEQLIQQSRQVVPLDVAISETPMSEDDAKQYRQREAALLEEAVIKAQPELAMDMYAKREALERLGEVYLGGREYDKAEDAYKRLVAYYESDPKVAQQGGFAGYPIQLVKIYLDQGRIKEAEKLLTHAIEVDDKTHALYSGAHSALCDLYMQQRQWAKASAIALKEIQNARAVNPDADLPGTVRNYAACQLQLKDPAPAIKLLKEEITRHAAEVEKTKGITGKLAFMANRAREQLVKDYCMLGECLQAAHDLKGAEAAFLEALKVDPESAIAKDEMKRFKKS